MNFRFLAFLQLPAVAFAATTNTDNNGANNSSSAEQVVGLASKKTHLRAGARATPTSNTSSQQRDLQSTNTALPLFAQIESLDRDFRDISGYVIIETDGNDPRDTDLIVEYDIEDGPERCRNCKLAIFSGRSCDRLDDPFFDRRDPYDDRDTTYSTDNRGRGAGSFDVDNGFELEENACQFVVLFDEEDEDDYDDNRRYSNSRRDDCEDYNRRNNSNRNDRDYDDRDRNSRRDDCEDYNRRYGNSRRNDRDYDEDRNRRRSRAEPIACGQLIPRGRSADYCRR